MTTLLPRELRVSLVWAFLVVCPASAEPEIPAGPATPISLVRTENYRYVEESIEPVEIIGAQPSSERSRATPLDACIGQLSSLFELDHEGWVSSWRPEEQTAARESYPVADFVSNGLPGSRVSITGLVRTGPYRLVLFEVFLADDDSDVPLELTAVFREVGGEFLATRELRADRLMIAEPWYSGETDELIAE